MIVLKFWQQMDPDKTPDLAALATFDEETKVATWDKIGTVFHDVLYAPDDHLIFGGRFDPENVDHWKAIPYLFHGHRAWATIEGAEAAIPATSTAYLRIMDNQRRREQA